MRYNFLKINEKSSTGVYGYGFNGMEKDDEVSGEGNSYTMEFRQYDPRLGGWLTLDPLVRSFPWQSPYVAFDNNPIYYTDPHGLAAQGPGDEGACTDCETVVGDDGKEYKANVPAFDLVAKSSYKRTWWDIVKIAVKEQVNKTLDPIRDLAKSLRRGGTYLDDLLKGSGDSSGFVKTGNELQSSEAEHSDQAAIKANSQGSIDIDWLTISKGYPTKIPTWSSRTEQVQNILDGVQKAQDAYEEYNRATTPNNDNKPVIGKVDEREIKQSLMGLTI